MICSLTVSVDAGEIALGDEVDDARHRVRAVGGAGAAGQHVDAIDQRQRDVVEIDAPSRFGGHDARAVEQDDVAVVAEAAKIDERGAAVAVVDRRADARGDARHIAQDLLGDVGLAQRDFVRADRRDRAWTRRGSGCGSACR